MSIPTGVFSFSILSSIVFIFFISSYILPFSERMYFAVIFFCSRIFSHLSQYFCDHEFMSLIPKEIISSFSGVFFKASSAAVIMPRNPVYVTIRLF
jgi:hypothetical protein